MNLRGESPNERPEIVKLLSGKGKKVLDIGCACGDMGMALKREFGYEVTGIEIDEGKAKIASLKLDKVLQGDVESIDPGFEEGYFEYIVFADVLEHLRNSLEALKKYIKYLKDDGVMVISMPNVRYVRVLYDLCVLGKWEYQPFGIMDEGHLRFFTKKSMLEMFDKADLSVLNIESIFSFKGSRPLNGITFGILNEFLTAQYVCIVEKKSKTQILDKE